MSGAMKQEDCDTCRRHLAGYDPRCPHRWEHIACSQAEDVNEQAAQIRELIRERDREKSQAEAAYDLAEQYAREAGVDIGRHDTLRYVEQYWEQRGNFERDWTALEGFRWEVWQLEMELGKGLESRAGEPAPVDALTSRVLAERTRTWLNALLKAWRDKGGKSKRSPDLFARPAPPQKVALGELFGGAA